MFLRRDQEALDKEVEPSDRLRDLLDEALTWHEDRETFGPPVAGGSRSQPVVWKMAVRCVERARRDAEWEREKERARENEGG